jgi:hypothetical protein
MAASRASASDKKQQSDSGTASTAAFITSSTPLGTIPPEQSRVTSSILETWASFYTGASRPQDKPKDRWDALEKSIVDTLEPKPTSNAPDEEVLKRLIDFENYYYVVAFQGIGPSSDTDLITVLVHTTDHSRDVLPYSTTLPGVTELRLIYINSNVDDLKTYCQSSPVPNPLIAQFIKATQAIKMPTAGGGKVNAFNGAGLYVHVSSVNLPLTRATIAVQARCTKYEDGLAKPCPDGKTQNADGSIPKADDVKGQYALTNIPLAWYSLASIGGGVLTPARRNKQYKVVANVLTSTPVSVATAIIGLDVFPWGRTNDLTHVTRRERFRVVPGLAVAPAFGPSVGGAFLLVDGFSLDGGLVWFRVNTLAAGEAPNSAPVSAKPLRLGWERLVYVGLGYNFN